MTIRVLTGINTTGTLHIGNYVGAIRPAIQASHRKDVQSFYFMADLHALIKCQDPDRIERSRLQIAATWLAAGLDPSHVVFYRQSDIPEIPLLSWMLTCVTAKGQMNRAHAYKAALEANVENSDDPDAGISMGLYSYPILMAADILMFNAHKVPVGKDQIQHLEMARDVATRFNYLYATPDNPFFVMPEAVVDETHEVLPGLDGRKMSKSYNNVIPLFEGGSKALKEAIAGIKTDSKLPGEPKDPKSTSLTAIYEAFSTPEEFSQFCKRLEEGLGWGEAKEELFEKIEAEIGPMRSKYEQLMEHPEQIEAILQEGARKAREIAVPFMQRVRQAVGLRNFAHFGEMQRQTTEKKKASMPIFKQYREKDGKFYFKLTSASGKELLQSVPFDSGRDCGQVVASLKCSGLCDETSVVAVIKDGETVTVKCVQLCPGVSREEIQNALCAIRAAEEEKRQKELEAQRQQEEKLAQEKAAQEQARAKAQAEAEAAAARAAQQPKAAPAADKKPSAPKAEVAAKPEVKKEVQQPQVRHEQKQAKPAVKPNDARKNEKAKFQPNAKKPVQRPVEQKAQPAALSEEEIKRRQEAKRKAEEEARAIREMMSKPKPSVMKAKSDKPAEGKKNLDKKKGKNNDRDRDEDQGGKKKGGKHAGANHGAASKWDDNIKHRGGNKGNARVIDEDDDGNEQWRGSRKNRNNRRHEQPKQQQVQNTEPVVRDVSVPETISVADLAHKMEPNARSRHRDDRG